MARTDDPPSDAERDIVQESSEDSFPASDAPSWTPVNGIRTAPADESSAPAPLENTRVRLP